MIGVGSRVVRPARWSIGQARGHGYERLRSDLQGLGVREGSILFVQASLRTVQPAAGGAVLMAQALLDVLGPEGTLVVPTHTSLNSLSSRAHKAVVKNMTREEKAAYVASLPPFDPFTTLSEGMGALAEHVRNMSDSVRSTHPHTSFAAVGPRAMELMKVHDLNCHLGLNSPLGKLYEEDADNLLLGLEYHTGCTMMHLAEYMLAKEREAQGGHAYRRPYWARIAAADTPDKWVPFEDLDLDDGHFKQVGEEFEALGRERPGLSRGMVGAADSRLVSSKLIVDFTTSWLRVNWG